MSKCKCDKPYTYRQSLSAQARAHGKPLAVAPMMPMDDCMKCWGEEINVDLKPVNLGLSELAKVMKEEK